MNFQLCGLLFEQVFEGTTLCSVELRLCGLLFEQVYTSYQFYVRACTTAGCNDGPSVSLSTAQMPPTEVKTPTLKVLGQFRAEIPCTCVHIFADVSCQRAVYRFVVVFVFSVLL